MPSNSGSKSKKARTSSSSSRSQPQPVQQQRLQQVQQFQSSPPQQWQQPQWQQPQLQWPQQWQQPQMGMMPQQPQQFMLQPGQQMMQHGQMAAQPQNAMSSPQQPQLAAAEEMPAALEAEVEESESEESEDDRKNGGYAKGLDAAITRSAVAVTGLPKTRLSELIEFVHEPFDSTVTADFGPITAGMLIWLLCRIKPNVKITDLRVGTYRELGALMLKAKKRIMTSMGASKFDDKIIVPLGDAPSVDAVRDLAMELGFNEEWFVVKKTAPKARAAPVQQQLLLPFVRPLPPHAADPAPLPAPAQLQPHQVAAVVASPAVAVAKAAAAPVAVTGAQPAPVSQARGSPEILPDMVRQAVAFWLQQQQQQQQQQQNHNPPEPAVVSPPAAVGVEVAVQPPAVDVEVPPAAEPPVESAPVTLCTICQSGLGSTSEYGEAEALACAHVFHKTCLDQYCSATGKNRYNCCPFKCSASAYLTIGDGEEMPEPAADGPAMGIQSLASIDEEVLQMAEEARAAALEMVQ